MSNEDQLIVIQTPTLTLGDAQQQQPSNMALSLAELAAPQVQNPPEGRTKRHFTFEEDNQIRQLVEIHGTNQWTLIAQQLQNRTARQVRDRYRCYLAPDVVHSEWTIEEEKKLMTLISQIGKAWAQLGKYFPGRTDVDLKNHWNKLQRHAKKIQPQQTIPDVPDLTQIKVDDVQMPSMPQIEPQEEQKPDGTQ